MHVLPMQWHQKVPQSLQAPVRPCRHSLPACSRHTRERRIVQLQTGHCGRQTRRREMLCCWRDQNMKATCNCPLWTLRSVNKQNHCYEVLCRAAISCHQSHKPMLKLLIQILISLKTNPKVNKEKVESVVLGKWQAIYKGP